MYIITTFMVAVFAILGFVDRKADKTLYHIEMFILGLMLCFRYGQGTDYFGYEANYSLVPANIDLSFLLHNNVHGEIGYTFLVQIFRSCGASFTTFIFFLSFVMMCMTYCGIKKYAKVKTIAVLLFYPTYYLTFFYAIRQGFGLAFALFFILPAWIDKNWIRYIVAVLIGATFHKSLLILLVPMVVGNIARRHEKVALFLASVIGILLAVILKTTGIDYAMTNFRIAFEPSVGAIILRIILFIVIYRLYKFSRDNEFPDIINDRLYIMYLVGFCIYLALCPMAFLSHRITAYMKFVEIVLISRMLGNLNAKMFIRRSFTLLKRHVCLLVVAICLVEGIKNINSYIGQGEYYSYVHFYNYPYVSVFNKADIYKYRENEYESKFPQVFSHVRK